MCTRKAPAQDGEREGMGRAHSHGQNMEKGATMEVSQGIPEHVFMVQRLPSQKKLHRPGRGLIFDGAKCREVLPPLSTFHPPSIMPVAVKRSAPGCADQDAKAKKVGLWRDANPTAPWDFRAIQRGR